jgi:hypothetical protein
MQRNSFRYEGDGWTTEGEKITSDENLARIRKAADEVGGIIVRHWFYRGGRGPEIRGFTHFEEFEAYLAQHGRPGDAFDVWSFEEVCRFDEALAKGKMPDTDGTVPLRAPY